MGTTIEAPIPPRPASPSGARRLQPTATPMLGLVRMMDAAAASQPLSRSPPDEGVRRWRTTRMAKYEGATWKPITANFNKGRRQSPTKGLILHITDGALNKKTGIRRRPAWKASIRPSTTRTTTPRPFRGEQRRRDVAIHRYRQPRLVGRWRHDRRALGQHRKHRRSGDTLSEDQIMACAGLLYWLNQTYDCPIKMAVGKSDSGVAYHSLFQRGHPYCPDSGDQPDPENLRQCRAGILIAARRASP